MRIHSGWLLDSCTRLCWRLCCGLFSEDENNAFKHKKCKEVRSMECISVEVAKQIYETLKAVTDEYWSVAEEAREKALALIEENKFDVENTKTGEAMANECLEVSEVRTVR